MTPGAGAVLPTDPPLAVGGGVVVGAGVGAGGGGVGPPAGAPVP